MARTVKPLNQTQIIAAKPKDKMYKINDGDGLSLWIYPTGRKVWRLDYTRKDKKRDTIIIGRFPDIGLADARRNRDELRAMIARGENPKHKNDSAEFFGLAHVAKMWLDRHATNVTENYAYRIKNNLELNIFPKLGSRDIRDIRPIDIVMALTPIEERGALDQLNRAKRILRTVYEFAISRGMCEINPVASIGNNAFAKPKRTNYRALKPEDLPLLVKALQHSRMTKVVTYCLWMQLFTLTRPSEVSGAVWSELNLDGALWVIPPERMKMNKEHIIPLSHQAVMMLREIQDLGLSKEFVFPGRDYQRPINRESARMALNRLGLDTTAHGLRALASTTLNESGLFRSDVVEAALAHVDQDKVRAAYNRAEYLKERREMLQWWADLICSHLDS